MVWCWELEHRPPAFWLDNEAYSRTSSDTRGIDHQFCPKEYLHSSPGSVGYHTLTPIPSRWFDYHETIEGITLHEWLSPRVTFPPEFHYYLDLLMNGDGTRIDDLRTILLGFEPTVDLSDSSELISDLKHALLELRAIPSPPSGQVSGANGMPFVTLRFSNRDILQPFENIAAFHEMLLQSCVIGSRMPRLRKLAKPVYAKQHRLCFSHSDLSTSNILVKGGRLAGIVDWETAGWFPEYCEYTMLQIRIISNVKGLRIFWDAVGVFGHEQYRDELELERALFRSTGDTALVPGIIPDDPMDRPISDDEAES
ncbi:uncharacterized protein BT62DRAFT_937354 [Guyanagaster necrorhizus]|uniref:Aminoglycoside phosphotransferase domain-containing protein n=1 Tax=Guyanagaster necrorhizus TaxID=856835 RepID=A0A9P8AMV6_9AGAR|nr:uncharacterized protein BT62DRAFT_937354 [Guyanagaster necrorhizus MCA 3950]KAG7441111.1 hypothetical protein BT62DRAFT_937354 [Guyanagaster necrorhizus MCA 3950]